MNQKQVIIGASAVVAGIALNVLGDTLTGVKIEIFTGIATFTFPWMIDIFLVPFACGFAVSKIYGFKGGKYLACIPPLIVRAASYLHLHYFHPQGDFFYQLNLYYWGPCVILAVESANFGGIIGEVVAVAYGGRNPRNEDAIIKGESS
jgi:hypothetical protein